jgi:hypothetical protein
MSSRFLSDIGKLEGYSKLSQKLAALKEKPQYTVGDLVEAMDITAQMHEVLVLECSRLYQVVASLHLQIEMLNTYLDADSAVGRIRDN